MHFFPLRNSLVRFVLACTTSEESKCLYSGVNKHAKNEQIWICVMSLNWFIHPDKQAGGWIRGVYITKTANCRFDCKMAQSDWMYSKSLYLHNSISVYRALLISTCHAGTVAGQKVNCPVFIEIHWCVYWACSVGLLPARLITPQGFRQTDEQRSSPQRPKQSLALWVMQWAIPRDAIICKWG